ncbi:hypothetical protein ACO0QE_001210 [Hanseniaspora vineae]
MEFYRDATWILEDLVKLSNKNNTNNKDNTSSAKKNQISGSLQTIVLKSHKKYKLKTNPKHIYAVVQSCYHYLPLLDYIYKKSQIDQQIPVKNGKKLYTKYTLYLCIHDLLLSKSKRIQMGKHPLKKFVMNQKTRLNAELQRFKIKNKISNLNTYFLQQSAINQQDLPPIRWFRLNLVKLSNETEIEKTINEITKKFPQRVDSWKDIESQDVTKIYRDEYIPHLFGVSPLSKITSHELYKQGKIIIQDRASCFPAHILQPTHKDVIIDSCSAPGNKTSHLASYIYSDGYRPVRGVEGDVEQHQQIIAFEKNPERAKILEKMLSVAGCTKKLVKINVGDFTKIGIQKDYNQVTGLLVDPSCSGSGIFGRKFVDDLNKKNETQNDVEDDEDVPLEEFKQQEMDKQRLTKLSSFQFQIVKHALLFPNAKKVVYSTCSVHAEENEQVVLDLLVDNKVKERGWRVRKREHVIPKWDRRGFVQEFEQVFDKELAQEIAQGCIRALPKEDGGIGFFAVCFERD